MQNYNQISSNSSGKKQENSFDNHSKEFKPCQAHPRMDLRRGRIMKSALMAAVFSTLTLRGAEKTEALTLRDKIESRALLDLVLLDSPQIEGIQIHHVIDKNGDGIIQAPDEIVRIYLNQNLRYNLHIREPIPPFGQLRVFVPQHEYWGTSIDVTLTQYAKNRSLSNKCTNIVDLTHTHDTNSYRGKPQGVTIIPLDEYRENYQQIRKSASADKITYYLTIMGKNGVSHSCSYTLDFSLKPEDVTNEAVVKK